MNEIILEHNEFKENLIGHTSEHFHRTLVQQINHWEQQSVGKVRQVADDLRKQLSNTVRTQTDHLKEQLSKLTQDLHQARIHGEFFENDVKQWFEQLEHLQHTFIDQQRVQIYQDPNAVPFISKISLRDESTTLIETYDDRLADYSMDEETHLHSTGEHQLRFKIEDYRPDCSIRFGIVSGTKLTEQNSTFYGWGENNFVYLAGVSIENFDAYISDYQADDHVLLIMDCDRERITLTNERTRRTHRLDVDLHKCPFPWQPHIRFFLNSE